MTKTIVVWTRLTEEQLAKTNEAAKQFGTTRSGLIRQAVLRLLAELERKP